MTPANPSAQRPPRPRRRLRRWIAALLLLVLAALLGVAFYVSEAMVRPNRKRISDSSRPVLGIVIRDAEEGGVRILRVVEPARTAGLLAGDRVVRLADQPAESAEWLADRIGESEAGATLSLRIARTDPDGLEREIDVGAPVGNRTISPADQDLEFEDVEFANDRGRTLRGWYLPAPPGRSPAPAVAYGHGNGTDRRHFLGLSLELHEAGFAQLLFDFAGRGDSDGETITLGAHEAGDLGAALDFLAGRPEVDPRRLALVGRSMGAAAAILCAAERDDVRALVLDSPFADLSDLVDEVIRGFHAPAPVVRPLAFAIAGWRAGFRPASVRPIAAIERVRAPILLLHGDADAFIPFSDSERIAAAAGGAVTLVPLAGLDHNSRRAGDYAERIAAFLVEATPAPGAP